MKTKLPPKGMRDFLPKEKAVREHVMQTIRKVYKNAGFTEIETSYIENIENLTGGDGGENTKLIFKILKRGDKLSKMGSLDVSDPSAENELSDLALRFDLTLPLVRFYANQKNELPTIFKSIQMGPVFRAERPQKGRYRMFTQCDIDMIGDETSLAEVDIILTISKALKALGLKSFNIKINDRRLLKALVLSAGIKESQFEDVAITLDKRDKVGEEGVEKELLEKGYAINCVKKLLEQTADLDQKGLEAVESISPESYENLQTIMSALKPFTDDFNLVFDQTLVRGMGYYTSTIFEVSYGELGYAIAGGGRYDQMIGKILGTDVPAIGFSIGFERIIDLLMESGADPLNEQKIALLFAENDELSEVLKCLEHLRQEYDAVSIYRSKKKRGKQIEQLEKQGYSGFAVYGDPMEVKLFGE